MTRPFILCADDYGMTEGVSRGILAAAVAGRISATSAMTSMPDWPRAAREWRGAGATADLGLHINLTLGAPIGPMPIAARSGTLPAIGAWVRGIDGAADEIAAEIGHQIDAFVEHAGKLPDHIDGHQHVHVLAGVREALFDALRSRGLRGILVRDSGEAPLRILRRRSAVAKAAGVAALARGFARATRAHGFASNDGFAGFSDFDPAADMEARFARFLGAAGPRHLVMCHPGRVDEALRRLDPVTDARETELRFLLSPAWPELLGRAGFRLARAIDWQA